MKSIERMREVAPNVFQASEKCFYIRIATGELKFCIKERLEKLLARANGDWDKLVKEYRTRDTGKSLAESPLPFPTAKND